MHRVLGFALCLLTGYSTVVADSPAKSNPVTHYDPDPAHLWNRMHATLLTRPDREAKLIGHDVLDPVVFPTTKRLLEGPTHVPGLFPVSVADMRSRSADWKTGLKDWAMLRKLAGW